MEIMEKYLPQTHQSVPIENFIFSPQIMHLFPGISVHLETLSYVSFLKVNLFLL